MQTGSLEVGCFEGKPLSPENIGVVPRKIGKTVYTMIIMAIIALDYLDSGNSDTIDLKGLNTFVSRRLRNMVIEAACDGRLPKPIFVVEEESSPFNLLFKTWLINSHLNKREREILKQNLLPIFKIET